MYGNWNCRSSPVLTYNSLNRLDRLTGEGWSEFHLGHFLLIWCQDTWIPFLCLTLGQSTLMSLVTRIAHVCPLLLVLPPRPLLLVLPTRVPCYSCCPRVSLVTRVAHACPLSLVLPARIPCHSSCPRASLVARIARARPLSLVLPARVPRHSYCLRASPVTRIALVCVLCHKVSNSNRVMAWHFCG
jgi:hypothetical protein